MKIFATGEQKFFIVKNLSKGRTRYWPTLEVRYIFYGDAPDIKTEYIYLTKTKRLYRITPSETKPYCILWGSFSGTNSIEELKGLKKQVATVQFEKWNH